MKTRYFFDSYAIVEMVKGNASYEKFGSTAISFTIMNLAEVYWAVLREFGAAKADRVFQRFQNAVVEIDDLSLKEGVKFRHRLRRRKLSYADAIGYMYAKRHGMRFLTGDEEFEDLRNVEFVK